MINSIGFTNFRRFKKFPELNLGEITILVGGNNAGKSTLVKAMLLMRDFLKSRIEKKDNIFKTFTRPQFSFDTEHVNVGDFYRAFCRQSSRSEDTISFTMKIDKFHFTVNIRGERKSGIIPEVTMIAVSDEDRDVSFTFDFAKGQMAARFGYDNEALNGNFDKITIEERLSQVAYLKKLLSESTDLAQVSDLKLKIEEEEKEIDALRRALNINIVEEESVTIDMSFFIGDNVGKLVIPELIKGFAYYSEIGTLGDRRSKEYREEEAKKRILQGKASLIRDISKEVEKVISSQTIEYIYAHSVNHSSLYAECANSSDYTKRTIHEFYTSRISRGDDEFSLIEDWLDEFGIGKSLKVLPYNGDNYRVVIFDDENPEIASEKRKGYPGGIDLTDKGMGSIQLAILLLRLATVIRKYKGQQLTILLEEPEQNLHPVLQSKLADFLFEVNQKHSLRFIIETHSEYLVRHAQVIAAKQIYEDGVPLRSVNESIKVYYISQKRGVVDMLFLDNAKFKDYFDEGFFDQAAREALTISRLERVNKK